MKLLSQIYCILEDINITFTTSRVGRCTALHIGGGVMTENWARLLDTAPNRCLYRTLNSTVIKMHEWQESVCWLYYSVGVCKQEVEIRFNIENIIFWTSSRASCHTHCTAANPHVEIECTVLVRSQLHVSSPSGLPYHANLD